MFESNQAYVPPKYQVKSCVKKIELGSNIPDMGIQAVVAVVSQHEHMTFRHKLQQ
jgi:hypothetical protein